MDRNKRRVNYAASAGSARHGYGLNDEKKKTKKKKGQLSGVKTALGVIALAALISVVVSFALSGGKRAQVGKATRIGATLSQNVEPFGDSVLFYDGTTLHCVAASGSNQWSYQIGVNANYDASQENVVAWSGNNLYVFNKKGTLIFNNQQEDTVQFASVGEKHIAAFLGDPDNGVIAVFDYEGIKVDNIVVENQVLLDVGFFNSLTSSSAQAVELMWTLGLNTTGTIISTEIQTFQPGKLSTGKSAMGEHIAYMIYDVNGTLNVVDTRRIRRYNYRVLEEGASSLIYGYTMADVRSVGKTCYQLLTPSQEPGSSISIENIRLIYDNVDRTMHLPAPCIAAALGTQSVYGFSGNTVYVCKFGQTSFTAYPMPVNVTALLGMITDNRVIVASGSEIYVVELPD